MLGGSEKSEALSKSADHHRFTALPDHAHVHGRGLFLGGVYALCMGDI